MRRWTPKLVLYLLLPYLVMAPPLLAAGYLLARRSLDDAAVAAVGAVALESARVIAARLPAERTPEVLARWCRDEIALSSTRLTLVAGDGRVICDSEVDGHGMTNHLSRPEIAAAVRTGAGIDRRESATVHRSLIYAAVRDGEGTGALVVRLAIPAAVLGASNRHLGNTLLLVILFAIAIGIVPALYLAHRIGWRLERMVGFSRTVAAGGFSARLPVVQRDELGTLEENLNEMGERLRQWVVGMHEEGEKTASILRAMIEGVVVIAVTGEVILINRRAEEIFGLASGADYRGRTLLEMCRDPELQELLRETIHGGTPTPHEREIMLTGRERRYLTVSVSPLAGAGEASGGAARAGPSGEVPAGFVLVFHDITELKKLETMRRDFVANVSHELRTPLTAIRGYAETLLAGALEDRRRSRQFLSVIDRHSERLSRLIDDLLTLSDLELGKTALKKEPVQLGALVDEVLEVLGEKAERGNVALAHDIPDDLPLLLGDGDRLQQVLINLTDNAVKYTPAGGNVRISARHTNGERPMVEVAVADSGVGIPADDLPRLTERFYRVDKARSRELGGTGLGLAIVKHIVQAHGGRLQITSELNVGTTVRFSVPGWSSADAEHA